MLVIRVIINYSSPLLPKCWLVVGAPKTALWFQGPTKAGYQKQWVGRILVFSWWFLVFLDSAIWICNRHLFSSWGIWARRACAKRAAGVPHAGPLVVPQAHCNAIIKRNALDTQATIHVMGGRAIFRRDKWFYKGGIMDIPWMPTKSLEHPSIPCFQCRHSTANEPKLLSRRDTCKGLRKMCHAWSSWALRGWCNYPKIREHFGIDEPRDGLPVVYS